MQTRKAWRNRGPSAGEEVLALLEALRDGLGAEGVGLFDDDRADPDPASARSALNFWDAFDQRPCADIDWDRWYRDLRMNQSVETRCGCGLAHHLLGFFIHRRWALLLVAPPTLRAGGAATITTSIAALAARLPPAQPVLESNEQLRPEPVARQSTWAAATRPIWWVRKRPE